MNSAKQLSIEEKLQAAVRMPQPDPDFLSSLRARLAVEPHQPVSLRERLARLFFHPAVRQRAGVAAGIAALLLAVGLLIAGPQRVFAGVRGLFGYIPGVGIVDSSAPIRVLAEPVIVAKDGIALTVTSAVLSGNSTHIEYRFIGVPEAAYPAQKDGFGCMKAAALRLPDGRQLGPNGSVLNPIPANMDFEPVPANVTEAVLVVPCIFNTLPGTVPENWEAPLRFAPAPPSMTVAPVIELTPSPQVGSTETSAAPASNSSGTADPTAPEAENAVSVQKVIETADGYILLGRVQLPGGGSFEPTGGYEIRDAGGKTVYHYYPQDVSFDFNGFGPDEIPWAAQFQAAGLAYPLTISFPMITLEQPDPAATAEFSFDAGAAPQIGQELAANQEIQLLGHTLKLVSLKANPRNGYDFTFQSDAKVSGARVQIEGYPSEGVLGGGGEGGKFERGLAFALIPTGRLKVIVSGLALYGKPVTWQGQWSPAVPRTDLANPTQPGVCLTQASAEQLAPAPESISWGTVLMHEQPEGAENGNLALYKLDGSLTAVVAQNARWGALPAIARQVAYVGAGNIIHIVQVDSLADQILPGAVGVDLHWEPNGKRIAYVHLENGVSDGVALARVDGTEDRKISTLPHAVILGWTPQGNRLYFAAPELRELTWKVYAYEKDSDSVLEMFTIENGDTRDFKARLSTDGRWIAYRGQDSGLYLVHPDGSATHRIIENASVEGMEWTFTGWLGISLQKPRSSEMENIMLKPESCEAYRLPATLKGVLQGLYLP